MLDCPPASGEKNLMKPEAVVERPTRVEYVSRIADLLEERRPGIWDPGSPGRPQRKCAPFISRFQAISITANCTGASIPISAPCKTIRDCQGRDGRGCPPRHLLHPTHCEMNLGPKETEWQSLSARNVTTRNSSPP